MGLLITGLVLFLGVHSVRIVADDWRTAQIAKSGEKRWKLVYTAISLVGFAVIVFGYAQARQATLLLYTPPVWMRHVAALLTLLSFILIAAAVRQGHAHQGARRPSDDSRRQGVGRFAHLLANGTLADVVLFGAFLAWAVLDFIASRRRDAQAASCIRSVRHRAT